MAKQSQNLTTALSYLITSQPFIAVLLMDLLEIVETDDPAIPTAATNNKHIMFNREWIAKLKVPELVFVIAHEVLHVVYSHLPRGKMHADRGIGPDFKKWSHARWNKATDYIINATLSESKIGRMPVGGLFHPDFTSADLAEDVYMALPYEEDDPNQPGAGQGGGFDQHLPPAANPGKGQVQRALAQASASAKAQGKLPGALARLAKDIMEPKQNWKEVLRAFMVDSMGHDQPTWNRLNRRKLVVAPHVAFPGTKGFKCGEVAIVVDTSGSISDKELNSFMSEINGIMEDAVPEECKVFWTDSRVAGIDDVDEYTDLTQLTPKGGGGTDMEAAFPEIADTLPEAKCAVVLTDMYTGFNEKNEPAFPVMWVSTTKDKVAPYGSTIYLDI